MDPSLLKVTVRNRDGIIFEGECLSVTSFNNVGRFDILPLHANFITLIKKELTLVTKNGENTVLPVDNGVCKVNANNLTIFLSIKTSTS